MIKRLDLWLIRVIAGAGLFLSAFDAVGLLDHIPVFENKVSTILLGVLSVTLAVLANLWNRTTEIKDELAGLRVAVQSDILTALKQMPNEMPANFGRLAGQAARDLVRQTDDLFTKQTFKLVGAEPFRLFYAEVLRQLPRRAVVHATSLPSRQYFWKSDPVDEAIKAFIKGGGTMKRLFFATSQELADPECRAVLDRQVGLGVQVFVCDPTGAGSNTVRLIFLIEDSPFGWEVRTTHRGEEIHEVTVSADPYTVEGYANAVQTIRNLCSPVAYDGSNAVF